MKLLRVKRIIDYANIYLNTCNTVLRFQLNIDHTATYDIISLILRVIFYSFYRASYASTVLAVIVCRRCPSVCLSVRLSVCHKSELYKDGWT